MHCTVPLVAPHSQIHQFLLISYQKAYGAFVKFTNEDFNQHQRQRGISFRCWSNLNRWLCHIRVTYQPAIICDSLLLFAHNASPLLRCGLSRNSSTSAYLYATWVNFYELDGVLEAGEIASRPASPPPTDVVFHILNFVSLFLFLSYTHITRIHAPVSVMTIRQLTSTK